MKMFENVPAELVDQTLSYCKQSDILNLSCCSKDYRTKVEPVLWKKVSLCTSDFVASYLPDYFFKNLHHTLQLVLRHDIATTEIPNGCMNYGYNLSLLLSNVSASKIVKLHLNDGVASSNTCSILLGKLIHLQDLYLHDISLNDWVFNGNSLQYLELFQCNISGAGLRTFIDRNPQLRHLSLRLCPEITDLLAVSTASNLISFSFEPDLDPIPFDVECIGDLKCLQVLELICMDIREEHMHSLFRSLHRLKELRLYHIISVTANMLSEIGLMQDLQLLSVYGCERLESQYLQFLVSLPALKNLSFDYKIFNNAELHLSLQDVLVLNTIPTLEVITIEYHQHDRAYPVVVSILEVLCAGLKKKWAITANEDKNGVKNYALHKLK